MFEKLITSKNFDFIGFNTSLEEFGRRSQISQKAIYRAQSVFEELGVQIILPQLPDDFALSVVAEYSQDEETVTMQLKYSGEPFDPATSDNMLSLKLAKNASQSMEHVRIREDRFANCVTVKIK